MPGFVADALHAKVTEISKEPDLPARLLLSGSLPVISTRAELAAFHDAERKSTSDLIKAANIKLYTIRVIDGNATLLKGCATNTGMYFDVTSASQLTGVFAIIAQNLANLRLAK